VLAQDIIYVGGGSTANLLAVWRLHGLDEVLTEAARAGVIMAGWSAGMNCWFEASVTDSFGPGLAPLDDGLGLLHGSCCPHYHGEEHRRPRYLDLVASGGIAAGYAVDDNCALVFKDGELAEAVSSREGAGAFRVLAGNGTAIEEPLDVRFLGGRRTLTPGWLQLPRLSGR
jgi:peptidase E